MANYSYMLLGTKEQIGEWRNRRDSDVKQVAAGRHLIPLLWFIAGRSDEVVCLALPEDETYVGFGCPVSEAISRFTSGHSAISSLIDGQPDFQPWANAMNNFLRARAEAYVEFDLTEIAMMEDGYLAEEIKEFLDAIASGEFVTPKKKQGGFLGWFAKDRHPLAEYRIRLALDADLLKSGSESLARRDPLAVAALTGAGWDDDFDEYFQIPLARNE